MAHAVDLDPRGYGGSYKLIGGAVALDFANLVSYRDTDRAHDWLDPASNVQRWAWAAGLSAPISEEIASLRQFREAVARVFLAVADGAMPLPDDVGQIGALAAGSWVQRRLDFAAGAPAATWVDTEPSLLAVVVADAGSLLTSPDTLHRVSACDECRWLFLDTSRNRSRRWCDPADCGNRDRQRRYYRRTRQQTSGHSGG